MVNPLGIYDDNPSSRSLLSAKTIKIQPPKSNPYTSYSFYFLLDSLFFARDALAWWDPNTSHIQGPLDIDNLILRLLMLCQEVGNCLALDRHFGYILKAEL
ncbi:hypothetical protein ACFX1S_044518 [Malus domestica]